MGATPCLPGPGWGCPLPRGASEVDPGNQHNSSSLELPGMFSLPWRLCLLFQNHPPAILSLEIPKASGQNQVFFPDTGSQEALPHWVTWYGLSCVPPRIPVLKLQPPGESV